MLSKTGRFGLTLGAALIGVTLAGTIAAPAAKADGWHHGGGYHHGWGGPRVTFGYGYPYYYPRRVYYPPRAYYGPGAYYAPQAYYGAPYYAPYGGLNVTIPIR